MNHRERLLDIANEAIAKLRAEGATTPWICKKAGLSPNAIKLWLTRDSEPQIATLSAVCQLAGFDLVINTVPRDKTAKSDRPNPTKVSQWKFAHHALQLGTFTKRSLASAAGCSVGASRHWVRRNKHCLEVVHVDTDGTTVWRWVGEQVAQPMAAE